jgi:signal transduction histidine kinase
MKKFIEKIIKFFQENNLLVSVSLTLIILSLALFISDFNLLKIFVFASLILAIFSLVLLLRSIYEAKKERISFFFSFIQNLLDYLQEGVVIYDDNFKIIFANQSFAELVVLRREDLIGLIVRSEMTKNERYQILANIFFPFLQGENLRIVKQAPETIAVKFLQPDEQHFLISYVDVYLDKKYKLRVVLNKTQDIIESQKRLEFLQMIHHNLLTPLSEIRWNLEALDLKDISQENKVLIETTLRVIKSTITLAESTLNLIRFEVGKIEIMIEEVDLENLIASILDILKEKIEDKNLKINLEIEEDLIKIKADRSILLMILFVVIENAVLYNKQNGYINIKMLKMPRRPYCEIIIEDSGIGMTKKDLANLFKKYYRGEKAKEFEVKGYGIGLYSAKNLVNLYGGDIKLDSEENKGTKITIMLPLDPNLILGYNALHSNE